MGLRYERPTIEGPLEFPRPCGCNPGVGLCPVGRDLFDRFSYAVLAWGGAAIAGYAPHESPDAMRRAFLAHLQGEDVPAVTREGWLDDAIRQPAFLVTLAAALRAEYPRLENAAWEIERAAERIQCAAVERVFGRP